jgi:hypothetical protein
MLYHFNAETRNAIQEKWGFDLTYRGFPVINHYCNNEGALQEAFKDEFNDAQECFLCYDPNKDVFMSGWDCWGGGHYGNDSGAALVTFKWDADGEFQVLDFDTQTGKMFYGRGGLFEELGLEAQYDEKAPSDLIFLRLD